MEQKVETVELYVNGENIAIKDFVQEFLGNTTIGMVKSLTLKNLEKIETIELKVELKK